MRLIDADAVIEVIEEVKDPTVATDVLDHIIATTPTAYDVDTVVEELKWLSVMTLKRMMDIVYGGFTNENH